METVNIPCHSFYPGVVERNLGNSDNRSIPTHSLNCGSCLEEKEH